MSKAVKGFTLVELTIALAVLAIIATLAVPAMTSFFDKRRVIEAAEDLYANVQLARTEAIARSRPVYIRFNSSGSSWQYGISQIEDCNLAKTDPTEANASACVLVVDDGDGNIDDGTATIDSADVVLHRYTNNHYTDVSMTLTAMPNVENQIEFQPNRGTAANATITLQSDGGKQMRVIVGLLGQVRLCSPAGVGHVGGYSSDGC
ncbi:GspH/FimT family pseudopilin [Kaarinaea lacus]